MGPPIERLNRDLVIAANGLQDIDVVWIDKGKWIRPETLLTLRDQLGATLVHFANDAMLLDNRSRQFKASIPLYDFHFTTKRFEVELYRLSGARHVQLVPNAVDSQRFQPVLTGEAEAFASDVLFIGRCEPHYARCLRAVARCGVQLRIWGPRWPRYARLHAWARRHVEGSGVWGDDYARALSGAKIALGLLSKRFPETVTTRSIEIPACGTFLLAERTSEHEEIFREGAEAEFFGSTDELVEKIWYYLQHTDEREQIAAAGRRRFVESGYSNAARFRRMLEEVVKRSGTLRLDEAGRLRRVE
jgi:spore maturation protein CgeB